MPHIDEIVRILEERGGTSYFGERVTQLEHALQAAWLAEQEVAGGALIVAALLHDIGHLLLAEDLAQRGLDGRHEDVGAVWLEQCFGPEVTMPVRLHVPAKRYLCAVDPDYQAALSPASIQSLLLQGGPMTSTEAGEFETTPHAQSGVRLRRWDDAAKVPGLRVPPLDHYRNAMQVIHRDASSGEPSRSATLP
jgi:gamma-butyrobetaine dioxygenase